MKLFIMNEWRHFSHGEFPASYNRVPVWSFRALLQFKQDVNEHNQLINNQQEREHEHVTSFMSFDCISF